ncbi:MAG: carbohydrate ABC transporter permease [Clostridiales bacterium]|jgi:putative aldouronate transport system permease protein|nr:carbohydrate ABC transporter permease [Clostridiales bacterium]
MAKREKKGELSSEAYVRSNFMKIGRGANAVLTIVMILLAATIILPLLLVVIISFSSSLSIAHRGYTFFPEQWTLMGYQYLFKSGEQVARSYLITIFYTVTGTVMALAVMSMFAFVLSQKQLRGRMFLTFFMYLTMLIHGGLVARYLIYTQVYHIDNTIWVFLLPGLVGGYNVFILRTFINTTIPDSLFEAAKIDGANDFTVYLRIVMPLFKAGLATIGLFNVVSRWNDWFTGFMYVENPVLIPLQTMLIKIQKNVDFIMSNSEMSMSPDGLELIKNLPKQSMQMAIFVVSTLPILCAYPFFQKYFISGLTIGSVKG